ncbi:hypothetical protein HA402_004103 [Bradysia odoriphaga]|nr:hypothetical protein HA402_004103 [Bradysia odoriphaga]
MRRERANHSAVGSQGSLAQGLQDQGARPEVEPAAGRGLHPRLHHHPEEAELGDAQGRSCEAPQRHRGHRLHPRRGPQPAGALARARPRRSCEGPPRCALQDRPWRSGHPGRQEP